MPSQTPTRSKNEIINVKLVAANNLYTADVSVSGPDSGKIVSIKDAFGFPVTYDATQSLIQANSASWKSVIDSSIRAKLLGTPGVAPTFNASNGTIKESTWDSEYSYALSSKLSTETNNPNTTELTKAIASQATPALPPQFVEGTVYIFPTNLVANKSSTDRTRVNSQDCIRIGALKYTPPQEGFLESVPKSNPSVGFITKFGMASLNNIIPRGMKYSGEVILPMPSEVRDALKTEWGISDLSALGFAMVGNISGLQELPGALGDATLLGQFLSSKVASASAIGSLIKSYGSGGPDLQRIIKNDVIASVISKIGQQVNPLDLLTRSTGKTVNTNAELLFRAPSLRVFELNWKLSPRSAKEAQELRKIIRFLKVNMLPRIPQGGAVLLQTPNVFVMKYEQMDGSANKSLPKPKICALTQMSADHTPDGAGWAAYQDSHPVSTVLRLGFAELTPLFANDYAYTEEDDVGL